MNLEDKYAEILREAHQLYETVQADMAKAESDGREITMVIAAGDVSRGDLIAIAKFNEDGSVDEEAEEGQARVLMTSSRMAHDDNGKIVHCVEALCVILQDGDIETVDEFASMYGNDEEETPVEVSAEEEPEIVEDPNVCSCGADRPMCEKNQQIFGGHLNE